MEEIGKKPEGLIAEAMHKMYYELAHKRLDHAASFALSGLKALFLVNGAAIVSLLTFIGNKDSSFDGYAIGWSFVWFSLGLLADLLAYVGEYFSQSNYMIAAYDFAAAAKARAEGLDYDETGDEEYSKGSRWFAFTLLFAAASLLSFVIGAFVALEEIT